MEYTALHYEKLSDQAKAPKRATPGSIGLDLFTPKDIFIPPKQQVLIPSHLILVLPRDIIFASPVSLV